MIRPRSLAIGCSIIVVVVTVMAFFVLAVRSAPVVLLFLGIGWWLARSASSEREPRAFIGLSIVVGALLLLLVLAALSG